MSYFVKWRRSLGGEIIEHYVGYGQPSEALDFACATLNLSPIEIWIENEHGNPIADKQLIVDHCRKRGLLPR